MKITGSSKYRMLKKRQWQDRNSHVAIRFKKTRTSVRQAPFWFAICVFFGSTLSSIFGTALISPFCSPAAARVAAASTASFFHENFQRRQWDTEWKTSFEFQRPDRTHCLHQPGKGPLDERAPSELIIRRQESSWMLLPPLATARSWGDGRRGQEVKALSSWQEPNMFYGPNSAGVKLTHQDGTSHKSMEFFSHVGLGKSP